MLAQQLHEGRGRELARVVDIFLVGVAQDQDFAAANGLAPAVDGIGNLADYPSRHVRIDAPPQF